MTRKLFILLLAALLTASVFTGCGAGTENTETTPIAAETTPVETEPETAPAAPGAPGLRLTWTSNAIVQGMVMSEILSRKHS